jgi:asparagine synthase (glutamine-hydrolysing)
MCGITGVLSLNGTLTISRENILRMMDEINHRGPDESGFYLDSMIGLGHKRLSIIDVAGGKQPIHNEDKSMWIVYNGEVYNYRELRSQLIKKGHRFYTDSDTEVVLHAYEEYGLRFLDELNGMFAFGIWDVRNKTLILARDRVGIKPLYYTIVNNAFVFGSEIKALLKYPDVPRRVDRQALSDYLIFRYPLADKTMFEGIKKLLPGYVLVAGDGQVKVKKYWSVPRQKDNLLNEADAAQGIVDLLEESVKMQLMSEVPLGVLLSGGIDSSAITYFASKNSRKPIKTFSVGFGEKGYSEFEYVDIMVNRCKTEHCQIVLSVEHFEDSLAKIIWHRDEPLVIPNEVPLYYLSKELKKHVTVVLSGEGADELFAGYPRYAKYAKDKQISQLLKTIPGLRTISADFLATKLGKGRNLLRRSQHSHDDAMYLVLASSCIPPVLLDELLAGGSLVSPWSGARDESAKILDGTKSESFIDKQMYYDMHTHLPALLARQDKMSMANSVEVRVPYLEHRLIDFASRIPANLKIRNGMHKYILKKAVREILQTRIIHRKKVGLPVPLEQWFKGKFAGLAQDVLLSPVARSRGYFNYDVVKTMLNEHKKGVKFHSTPLWMLLNLELWHRIFIDKKEY